MILNSVTYIKEKEQQGFPFTLPLLESLDSMTFNKPVTILVGENGTGKSTLIQAIADQAQSIRIDQQNENPSVRLLSNQLKLTWSIRTRDGFFLTAEDFVNYVKRVSEMREEAKRSLEEIEIEYKDRSQFAKNLASMPHNHTLYDLQNLYDDGLEFRSHGERFLDFFQSRLRPKGLYILDEPEVPLSPTKQLSFISLIKEMTKKNAQFIIATHSPILMAIPDAEIISLDSLPPKTCQYEDLEHVQLTKSFLESPERFLRHL
ncbi:AAA family ATPase [Fictibacillus nanhaiensis]|uniref:AAA family ATPase n=1 Tax=Fictibacillus nanhaiensis TaxID=742169 RepID=UPI001C976190|nr:AAA family ATPase [Fictibacillus nanhaiensis]MBY6036588.1 AAA family ATPase [Fictibacillus nanhaiensis]